MKFISIKEAYISLQEAHKSQWNLGALKKLISLKKACKS